MSIINQMIEGVEAQDRAAKEEREAKKKAIALERFEDLKSYLGSFWDELIALHLKQEGKPLEYSLSWDGDLCTIEIDIPALIEPRLAPIGIRWNKHSRNHHYHSYNAFRVEGSRFGELAEALAEARKQYPKFVEKRTEERIEWYRSEFSYFQKGRDKTEEEISALLSQFEAEFPERIEKGRAAVEAWKQNKREKEERLEEERRSQEAREAAQALRKTLELGYIFKLAEYMQAHDEASSRNEALAMMNQEIEDSTPYTVYQLTYAVIGEWTEDGETFRELETRSVYVLDEDPDEDGHYRIGDNRRIKYIHGVSVEPIETIASKGIFSRHIDYEGFSVHFQPGTTDETIKKILSGVEKLPQEPEAPQELEVSDRYSKRNYYAMARKYLESGKIGEASDDWTAPDDLAF